MRMARSSPSRHSTLSISVTEIHELLVKELGSAGGAGGRGAGSSAGGRASCPLAGESGDGARTTQKQGEFGEQERRAKERAVMQRS